MGVFDSMYSRVVVVGVRNVRPYRLARVGSDDPVGDPDHVDVRVQMQFGEDGVHVLRAVLGQRSEEPVLNICGLRADLVDRAADASAEMPRVIDAKLSESRADSGSSRWVGFVARMKSARPGSAVISRSKRRRKFSWQYRQ